MKKLSELTTAELEKELDDLEYALSGLAQMGGGELPKPELDKREALQAELQKRRGPAKGPKR